MPRSRPVYGWDGLDGNRAADVQYVFARVCEYMNTHIYIYNMYTYIHRICIYIYIYMYLQLFTHACRHVCAGVCMEYPPGCFVFQNKAAVHPQGDCRLSALCSPAGILVDGCRRLPMLREGILTNPGRSRACDAALLFLLAL